MAIRTYLRSFNGGVVSPAMYARIDTGKYQTGLAEAKNFLIDPQGPAVMRPGFEYVNKVGSQGSKPRLIPFSFSLTETMVLEFGDRYIRFHTQGKTLMKPDGSAPYEVQTDYRGEDLPEIHYVQSADVMTLVHPNYPPRELKRYSLYDWRIEDIRFSTSLTAPGAPTVSQHINGKVENPTDYVRRYCVTAIKRDGTDESEKSGVTEIACNPYGEGAYNTIQWNAVAGAEMYRVYREVGGVYAYIGQTEDTRLVDENISADASIVPPTYDDPFYSQKGILSVNIVNGGSGYDDFSDGIVAPDKLTSQFDPNTLRYYTWTARSQGGPPDMKVWVEDADGIGYGAVIKPIYSRWDETIEWTTGREDHYHEHSAHVWYAKLVGIDVINPGRNYKTPRLRADYYVDGVGGIKHTHGLWTGDIHAKQDLQKYSGVPSLVVSDPTGYGAELQAVVTNGAISYVRIVKAGQNYTNPIVTVYANKGAGGQLTATAGTAGDYPCAVTYYQQRRWFAGTPTRPNNIWASRTGTEADMSYSLPTKDTDRLSFRVMSYEVNRIRHLVPMRYLMALTGSAEWVISSSDSGAITAQNLEVSPQAYNGVSTVMPLVINSQMIFAKSRGGHIAEYGYRYDAGGFVAGDLCLMAPHLFDGKQVVDMCYSKAPIPTIWIVSSDGSMIAFTYVPEQSVGAFSTIETEGTFESCCCVSEGSEDVLYVATLRKINGVQTRFIERLHERAYAGLEEACFMDCAGTYRGAAKQEISGLSWLEGEEVAIMSEGSVEPRQVVKGGKITLSTPSTNVKVGLPYSADMKTLPISLALQDGSYGSGHQKNVRRVFFRVVDSSGMKAGPDYDNLAEYAPRSTEPADTPPYPITDEFGFAVYPAWSSSGQVCVRQDNPLPLKIISMTVEAEVV